MLWRKKTLPVNTVACLGTLSHQEFMEGFKKSGSSSEELEDLFLKLDVNANREILHTEFLAATLEAEGELEEGHLQEAFGLIDEGHSGCILPRRIWWKCLEIQPEPRRRVVKAKRPGKIGHKTLDALHSDKILKKFVEEIFTEKDRISYEDFAQLFEHGFDARPSMDAIVETSLNEEQLSCLRDSLKHI
jgi:Ca2+-binding EF-hand superfamily protein